MLLSSGLKHMPFPLAAERKRSVRLRCLKVTKGKFLFGARKPHFLGMHQFRFLSEAFGKTVTFCIYQFYFFNFFLIPIYH